jgi:AdoMet-dependent rRNA methyltransferase SPB1
VEDEEKNCKRMPNVPYNIVSKYKKKYEDIDARPIKKVVEAQARKKRRVSQKLLFFF